MLSGCQPQKNEKLSIFYSLTIKTFLSIFFLFHQSTLYGNYGMVMGCFFFFFFLPEWGMERPLPPIALFSSFQFLFFPAFQLLRLRGMVKNLPQLRRAGNNGCPWIHAVTCDNTFSDICMIINDESCFNLAKSVNRYWLHMIVRCTTRAYNGTIATKGLFIMCPSANIIGKKKISLFCRLMTQALFSDIINRQQNLILWDRAPLHCGKERTRISLTVY